MALSHGRNAAIYVNGVDISGDLNTVTPNSEQDLIDVSVFGNKGHTFYPGLAKDSATIEALYNSTERVLFEGMIQAASSYSMMVTYGDAVGTPAYATNEVTLKSNTIKSVVTDVNRATINVETKNYPFESGYLLTTGKVSSAATAGDTIRDDGAASALGGVGYIQVFSVSSGTFTGTIEQSSTGAWAGESSVICTFPGATGACAYRVATVSTTVYRYTRAVWSMTGTTSVFAIAFKRY